MMFVKKVRPAFTLIELLTVVVIIGVIAGIAFPVLSNARAAAREARCTGNLRSLGMAVLLCAENEGQMFPYGVNSGWVYWNRYISDYLGGAGSNDSVFFCPAPNVDVSREHMKTRTNYISNRRILADGQKRPDSSIPSRIAVDSVLRPSEVALLFDGAINAGGYSDFGIWKQTGFDRGSINEANKIVPNNEQGSTNNACISWRHGGKTNVVFVDGHVASVPFGELLYKNLQIAY